jgi:hypothetical protein
MAECASVTVNWAPPALPASLCSSSHFACDSGLRPGEPPLFIDGKFTGPRDRKSLQTNGLCGLTVGAAAGSPAEPGVCFRPNSATKYHFQSPESSIMESGPNACAVPAAIASDELYSRLPRRRGEADQLQNRREKAKAGGRLIRGSTVSRPIAAGTKLAENMPRLRAPLINPAARAFRSRRGGRRGARPRRAAMTNPRDWRRSASR